MPDEADEVVNALFGYDKGGKVGNRQFWVHVNDTIYVVFSQGSLHQDRLQPMLDDIQQHQNRLQPMLDEIQKQENQEKMVYIVHMIDINANANDIKAIGNQARRVMTGKGINTYRYFLYIRGPLWNYNNDAGRGVLKHEIEKALVFRNFTWFNVPCAYEVIQEGKNCAMTSLIAGLVLFRSHGSKFSVTAHELLSKYGHVNLGTQRLGDVGLSQDMYWRENMWFDEYRESVVFRVLYDLSGNKTNLRTDFINWYLDVVMLYKYNGHNVPLEYKEYKLLFALVTCPPQDRRSERITGHKRVVYRADNTWYLYDTNVGQPAIFDMAVDGNIFKSNRWKHDKKNNEAVALDDDDATPWDNTMFTMTHPENVYVYSRHEAVSRDEYVESFGGRPPEYSRAWLIAALLGVTGACSSIRY